jgi:hypothetical protein
VWQESGAELQQHLQHHSVDAGQPRLHDVSAVSGAYQERRCAVTVPLSVSMLRRTAQTTVLARELTVRRHPVDAHQHDCSSVGAASRVSLCLDVLPLDVTARDAVRRDLSTRDVV